jgi:hypothetical protein
MVTVLGLAIVIALTAGTVGYLVGSMVWSIRKEKRSSGITKTWSNFGLSIAFCVLFLGSWLGQGIAEWQVFVDEQREHNETVEVVDYLQQFTQSTLENWQSEFLQLFSFVVLSALLIHRGSAESKDSDDRMEEILKRIEKKVGA